MCGCLLPSKPGSTCCLRDRICQSFNLYKVLFQSQPAEDGQVTPPPLVCSVLMVVAEFKVGNQVRRKTKVALGKVGFWRQSGKRLTELVLL